MEFTHTISYGFNPNEGHICMTNNGSAVHGCSGRSEDVRRGESSRQGRIVSSNESQSFVTTITDGRACVFGRAINICGQVDSAKDHPGARECIEVGRQFDGAQRI